MMIKKTFVLLITSMLILGAFVGVASADEGPQNPQQAERGRFPVVEISRIGEGYFMVNTRDGELRIEVTAETIFKDKDDKDLSFADLSVGDFVTGHVVRTGEGQALAKVVVLLPEGFQPQERPLGRVMGTIEKLNPGQNTFELQLRGGELLTIATDEKTIFKGAAAELKDLKKGMHAVVAVLRTENGPLAKLVLSRDPENGPVQGAAPLANRPETQQAIGQVLEIEHQSLRIETRQGAMQFQVTGDTVVKSRNPEINSLEDIEAGMLVAIRYKSNGQGNLQALLIAVGRAPNKSLSLRKVVGEIQNLGDDSFSVQLRNGDTLSFALNEETRFASRDGSVNSFTDLQVGQTVLVAFRAQEDGSFLAKLVAKASQP